MGLQRSATIIALTLGACLGWPASDWAQAPQSTTGSAQPQPASPPAAAPGTPAWHPDDRVTLGGNWASLTGTDGGEGAILTYLAQVSPDATVGVGGQYQRLAGAWWAFGSLSGSYSHALTTRSRWNIHADANEGGGQSSTGASTHTSFGYNIVGAGLGVSLPHGVALDAENRWLDVYPSRGWLPKVTLAKSWSTHWLTTVAYAHSYSGNLDTSYGLVRVDFYGRGFGLLAGGDVGRVAPAVLNINGLLQAEARHFTEVFAGVTKTISRVDLSLLGDHIDLLGIEHLTVTLNCTIHL